MALREEVATGDVSEAVAAIGGGAWGGAWEGSKTTIEEELGFSVDSPAAAAAAAAVRGYADIPVVPISAKQRWNVRALAREMRRAVERS